MISNSNSTITAILTRRKMKILDLNVFHFKVFVTRKIQIMTISTSWTNMATMSFPCQPLIPYRAAAHARRPLKSSTRPASEGSRRYVIPNSGTTQNSVFGFWNLSPPSVSAAKKWDLSQMVGFSEKSWDKNLEGGIKILINGIFHSWWDSFFK